METNSYYIFKIKEALSHKQRVNKSYSLRAFANFLNIHSSTLSQILKGKRKLPLNKAYEVAQKLQLNATEKTLFIDSIFKSKTIIDDIKISENDDRKILDESYSKVIAEWEHYAILTLFDLDDFLVTKKSIQEKFDISANRIDIVLTNLLACELIKEDNDGSFQKSQPSVRTTEDVSFKALRDSHIETLEMGKNKIEEIDLELRDFSSITMAVDPDKINEMKIIIREFRQKMSGLVKNGKKKEIFQLAIQLYPLTKMN